jgi:hypothetical protein
MLSTIASTENYWHTLMRYLEESREKELYITNLLKNLCLQLRESDLRRQEVYLMKIQIESEMDRRLLEELKFLMVFIPFVSILALMWQKDGSNIVCHLFTVSRFWSLK